MQKGGHGGTTMSRPNKDSHYSTRSKTNLWRKVSGKVYREIKTSRQQNAETCKNSYRHEAVARTIGEISVALPARDI
jgi:hypothetical protein